MKEKDAQERELLLVECLAERAERGELTVRQLYEALGRPLSAVPTEVWDNKVFGGPVKRIEVQRIKTSEWISPEKLKEMMARVSELAERAKRGELTVRETFEALGWPLSVVGTEVRDSNVSMEDIRKLELYLGENRFKSSA